MNALVESPLIEAADAILEVLHHHANEWVSSTALLEELGFQQISIYHKAALEHLALNRRIFMRAVSTPSEYHYEYKLR